MTATEPTTATNDAVPGYAADHADRWRRLREERRFRLAQLADLDSDPAADPRHESVRKVLRTSALAALSEVEAALARLEDGTYGTCVTCARSLDAERLDILPMASLCMACHYNEQNCHVTGAMAPRS
ncbi:TraR/DksA family transcriptional regulator [Nocardioides caldifontis]|uniref:TraR/DksA family transcriptional regulator n=1 Tax=Nocardioides caldifontis TaxID=2588938 RepID=UPI0011DF6E46|nr:molecular chaperone DnaK [Nocardioides caldifontis]